MLWIRVVFEHQCNATDCITIIYLIFRNPRFPDTSKGDGRYRFSELHDDSGDDDDDDLFIDDDDRDKSWIFLNAKLLVTSLCQWIA